MYGLGLTIPNIPSLSGTIRENRIPADAYNSRDGHHRKAESRPKLSFKGRVDNQAQPVENI